MRKTTVAVLTMVLLMAGGRVARAAEAAPEKAKGEAAEAKVPEPRKFASEHRLKVNGGGELVYTARAEDVYLRDKDGKPTATFFTISYVKKGVARWSFFDHPSGRSRILMAMRWKAEQGRGTEPGPLQAPAP